MTPELKAEVEKLEKEYAVIGLEVHEAKIQYESLGLSIAPLEAKQRELEAYIDERKPRLKELTEKLELLRKVV